MSVVSARVHLNNKVLDADYYRRLEEENAIRKGKTPTPRFLRKSKLPPEKQVLVAEDIRTLGRTRAMLKWRISQSTYDKLYGEMLLGKLGGLTPKETNGLNQAKAEPVPNPS